MLTIGAGGYAASPTAHALGAILVQTGGVGPDLIADGGLVEAQSGGALVDAFAFGAGGGELRLDAGHGRIATVSGFGAGDLLDFRGVAFNAQSASIGFGAGVLSIFDGVHQEKLTLS